MEGRLEAGDLWTRVSDIVADALELPEVERSTFVASRCEGNTSVRLEVERLLKLHQKSAEFLEMPLLDLGADRIDLSNGMSAGDIVAERFEVRRLIGSGGMGEVYEAFDRTLHHTVAIKRLRSEFSLEPVMVDRFRKEVLRARQITHPNVCRVYEMFVDISITGIDTPFFTMELLQGQPLKEWLKERGPLLLPQALPLMLQMASALDAAHRSGIIHKDFKPANVFVCPAADDRTVRIVVGDFGLAAQSAAGVVETSSLFATAGTRDYMAPEQLSGMPVSPATDVYALGLVMCEMLYGQRIPADNPERTDERGIRTLLQHMLAADPAVRCPNGAAVLEALLRTQDSSSGRPRPRLTAQRSLVAAAALAVFVAGVFAATRFKFHTPNSQPTTARQILIAEIENVSGEAGLGKTVQELLTLGLEQSPDIRLVPRSRIAEGLRRMQRPLNETLSFQTVRELSLREGVPAFIAAKLLSTKDRYRLDVRSVDPKTLASTTSVSEEFAEKDGVTAAVDRVVAKMSEGWGAKSVSSNSYRPLAMATTASYEALERYSEAVDLERKGQMDQARLVLENVIGLDPQFAMAYRRLANHVNSSGDAERALSLITRAYELRDRVTERERYIIEGNYHFRRYEFDESIQTYRTIAALFGDDADIDHFLANAYMRIGQPSQAAETQKRALELQPSSVTEQGLYAVYLAQANHADEAVDTVRRYRTENPSDKYLKWVEGYVQLVRGDFADSQNIFQELIDANYVVTSSRLYLAQNLILRGELRSALRTLKLDTIFSPINDQSGERRARIEWAVRLQLLLGDKSDAVEDIKRLDATPVTLGNFESVREAGLLYAEAGRLKETSAIRAKLESFRREHDGKFLNALVQQLSGEVARLSGQGEAARKSFELAREGWTDPLMLWSIARFYLGERDDEKAADFYGALVAMRGDIMRLHFGGLWVMSLRDLAAAESRTNRSAEAAAHLASFNKLWGTSADFNNSISTNRSTR